ncbi:MAG: DNA/RNA non-specific endonuclease [Flavobacteriales bacterium]|nr:MAG: DNA/RNA non-specific endonuclease [Flavobacteriales bacterium]CAI8359920.1 MAG: Nuclease [Flavobacteriales bacterium]|tara:strand:+ start:995 stop:1645 length:651 start_codon:yes stop_codon:yes gene_type:complete
MKKFLFLSLIIIASCNKENKNISEADSFEETISKNLDRERKDSLLVSSNIFEISYNEKYEQPNWVKYTVRDIIKNADRDGINFYTVDTIYTSDDNDYYSNRWDRGHMAPAGSFNDSYENLYSTFTYLNVALQYDDLNRGAWVNLEEQVREWAVEFGDIDIEIYLEFNTDHIILETGAHVPSAFYKYIIFPNSLKRCFYFPNVSPNKTWQDYEIDCD